MKKLIDITKKYDDELWEKPMKKKKCTNKWQKNYTYKCHYYDNGNCLKSSTFTLKECNPTYQKEIEGDNNFSISATSGEGFMSKKEIEECINDFDNAIKKLRKLIRK